MSIFDWLFGNTDDGGARLEDMILMDMDDEDDKILVTSIALIILVLFGAKCAIMNANDRNR